MSRRIVLTCLALLLACQGGAGVLQARATDLSGYDFVHDPSMITADHTYYLFSTGAPDGGIGKGNVQIRTSTDLRHWRYRGTVYQDIPGWITDAVGPIPNLWAPDISYWHGLYHLYYAGSSFGTSNSVIGLATNTTRDLASPAYHWVDRGLVIRSMQGDDWNAIDPNLATDATGHPWLAFGSFWSGIKLMSLDPRTGKPATAHPLLHSLARRPSPDAIEAAFISYRAPYYYLFVSFDSCCKGVDSTYRIMVGRARAITGPYLDRAGRLMTAGGGTQLLASNGYERGPGGQSIAMEGGAYLLVYHYYDARANGNPKVQVRKLSWTADGWPRPGARLAP